MRGDAVLSQDQYALAVMTYELLTGTLPFEDASPARMMYQHLNTPPPLPSVINPLLSGRIDRVLLKALEKEPRDRFPCVAAFAYALSYAGRSTVAASPSRVEDEPWDRFWEPTPFFSPLCCRPWEG